MLNNKWSLVLIPSTVISFPVYAKDYLTAEQAQKILFPRANRFTQHIIKLTSEQKDQIKEEAGVRQRNSDVQAWKAFQDQEFIGWIILDEVIGKHEYITYAAAISKEAKVFGIEILSYRETHGGEVRELEWRQHFKGKSLNDAFKLNKDIPNISGATLSCRNLTDGVKRLLVLHKVVLKNE